MAASRPAESVTLRAPAAAVPMPAVRLRGGSAVTGAALVVLAALVAWPLAAVVSHGVPVLARVGSRPLGALGATLSIAATSAVVTLVLGFAIAYAATRTTLRGAARVLGLLPLALMLPPFLPALALRAVGAGRGIPMLVVAQALSFVPVAAVILGSALAAANADEESVAESLGASATTIFLRITLPPLRVALTTAAAVVFVLCATDLANPLLIAGVPLLAVQTYRLAAEARDVGAAAATALWLLLPCAVATTLAPWREGAVLAMPVTSGRPRRAAPRGLTVALACIVAGVALALAANWAVVLTRALGAFGHVDWRPLGTSLTLAAAASVVGTTISLAVGARAGRGVAGAAAALLARVPLAVPGVALGIGVLLTWDRWPSANTTLWPVIAAVVAARLPAGVDAARRAVGGLDGDGAAAAVGLGAGRSRVLARVVAPLLAPAALSLMAHFFVRTLVVVGVVSVLVRARDVAAFAAVADAARGRVDEACALVVALSIVVVVVVALRSAVTGQWRDTAWLF